MNDIFDKAGSGISTVGVPKPKAPSSFPPPKYELWRKRAQTAEAQLQAARDDLQWFCDEAASGNWLTSTARLRFQKTLAALQPAKAERGSE